MISQLVLPAGFETEWRKKIERQLDLTLASVHWQIKRLVLVLDRAREEDHDAIYYCQLEVKLRSGRSHRLIAKNRDPQACTADAAARLRREIVRDKQLGLLGKVS